MFYELFDIDTANQVGVYPTEAEALAVVRHVVETFGPDAVRTLALGREDETGDTTVIAAGAALVHLAGRSDEAAPVPGIRSTGR